MFRLMPFFLLVVMISSFGQAKDDNTPEQKHSEAGVACRTCHGEKMPADGSSRTMLPTIASKEMCLSCHGSFAVLAERTKRFDPPFNAHDSHWGELDCYQCHREHRSSELFCASCHVGIKLPTGWKARQNPADEEIQFQKALTESAPNRVEKE